MDALTLMKENISKTWINTDMGSGWLLTLYSPFVNQVVAKMKYLDIFDGEDDFDYEDWQDFLEEWAMEDFVNRYKDKYLHHFEELLISDEY